MWGGNSAHLMLDRKQSERVEVAMVTFMISLSYQLDTPQSSLGKKNCLSQVDLWPCLSGLSGLMFEGEGPTTASSRCN